jgi:hypothetical protein
MLLSLSFEEYEQWANTLGEIRRVAEILVGQVPIVSRARQDGRPWVEMLRSFAASYYRDGVANHRQLWSEAVATYHLILVHRQALRVDRTTWGHVAARHGVLSLRLGSSACPAGTRVGDPACPEDPSPIVASSMAYVTEYLTASPNDPEALKVLGWQRQFLARFS